MIALAGEIEDGIVFSDGTHSHMASLSAYRYETHKDPAFFISDIVPTCISDDIEAAKAVNRGGARPLALLQLRNYSKKRATSRRSRRSSRR